MKYDPTVWGPHYWFFLHSVAVSYPERPNQVTKKTYYRLIQDFSLYMPDATCSAKFAELIDMYPVTPYLDTRMSFMKWTHFIHNKINEHLGKPVVPFYDALEMYYENYKPKELREKGEKLVRERTLWTCVLLALLGVGAYYKFSYKE